MKTILVLFSHCIFELQRFFNFSEMLTELALLTALTLNTDEREVLRDKINEWVKLFLPKLERKSTRTEK